MSGPRATTRRVLYALVGGLALLATACEDVRPQDYLDPIGKQAVEVDKLWNYVFYIAVAVFFIVEGALVYALIRFRHRKGDDREPEQFHGNTKLEVILTLIPALILAGLAIPTVKTLFAVAAEPKGEVLHITVIGHQFWWEYIYEDLGLETANELHIPTGTNVRLTLEGDVLNNDVIHAFWVPKIAGKQDLVPGRQTFVNMYVDQPGEYLGQCTEFCGASHANMRIRLYADPPAEFQEWVDEQKQEAEQPTESLAAEGARLFQQGAQGGAFASGAACATCHTVRGTDAQGTLGPDLTHFASRAWFAGAIFENNDENLEVWLQDPPNAKPGVKMPDLGLTGEQIQALIAYLRTLE